MSVVEALARPEILALEPYASARRDNHPAASAVRLDANESPWPAFPTQLGLNRYPEPQPQELVSRLADLYEVAPENVLVTRGSDEAIDLLMRAFCRPGVDAVVDCPPTFSFYRVAAAVQGAKVLSVPRDEAFALDLDAVEACCNASASPVKLVFICTPNNPSGNACDPEALAALCGRLENHIVVVDEAYAEFSSKTSLATWLSALPNLVILRTLSKAFGLAGARCGATLASPEIVRLLRSILAPYPLPTPSVEAALEALSPHGISVVRERIELLAQERGSMSRALAKCPRVQQVLPSEANFLLLEVDDGAAFTAGLRSDGILVRYFGDRLPRYVRVSVGSPEENALLLKALGVGTEPRAFTRSAVVSRRTKETDITASILLRATAPIEIDTGIGFYDHMLEQVARHGGFGLRLSCAGDTEVDAHHTVEDCALAFGDVLRRALGDKRGIARYGFSLPMDEARATVLVDLSGRPSARFDGELPDLRVGGLPTEMVPHVFESLAQSLGAAIHVSVEGVNTHHMVEACFKGLGRCLRQAIQEVGGDVPSTKGVL